MKFGLQGRLCQANIFCQENDDDKYKGLHLEFLTLIASLIIRGATISRL